MATPEDIAKKAAEAASLAASRHVADVWQARRDAKAIVTRTIAILSATVQRPETVPEGRRRWYRKVTGR